MKRSNIIAIMIMCLIFCACPGPVRADGDPLDLEQLWSLLFGSGQRQEQAVIPHDKTVDALRSLGIEVPDQTVEQTERNLEEMILWSRQAFPSRKEQPWEFTLMLLDRIGWGNYDYVTGEWTPTSSDVYAFDAEVFDICHMYTLFLQGVSSIVPGFVCTDIAEVIDEWDETEIAAGSPLPGSRPEGITTVRFTLNGHSHEMRMNYYGDWFDETAIDQINTILAAEGFSGRIIAYMDGGQGLILFYGDDAFAGQLEKIMPLPYK